MKQTLSFFQIFDLAFFAPGVILVTVIVYASGSVACPIWSLTHAEGLLVLLGGLAAIYVLGLIVHSIVFSCILVILDLSKPACQETPSALVYEASTRDGLVLYFWYLRATCWNVAMALVLSLIPLWVLPGGDPEFKLWLTVPMALAVPLLVAQGADYHKSYYECISALRKADNPSKDDG